MKQVVFAIALLAMASLTGCLNGDDSSDDKTDDTTSDTTDDNTDTTQDDTDTIDDTKDDELIEPVGTNGGYSPPETASIKLDWTTMDKGEWACTNEGTADVDCQYTAPSEDTFWNPCPDGFCNMRYHDADTEHDEGAGFMGWVNKTGNTITIEALTFPNNDNFGKKQYAGEFWRDYKSRGMPVYPCGNMFNIASNLDNAECEIIIYGNDGLIYMTQFNTHTVYETSVVNELGDWDHLAFWNIITTTIDLPFEPVMFEIGTVVKVF